jgi:hypothetical protein
MLNVVFDSLLWSVTSISFLTPSYFFIQIILMKIRVVFLCWKNISGGELTSDIDMNEFVCLSYTKWGIFIEDLPFNESFVASAKQNRLTNIKVSQKIILTYHWHLHATLLIFPTLPLPHWPKCSSWHLGRSPL